MILSKISIKIFSNSKETEENKKLITHQLRASLLAHSFDTKNNDCYILAFKLVLETKFDDQSGYDIYCVPLIHTLDGAIQQMSNSLLDECYQNW